MEKERDRWFMIVNSSPIERKWDIFDDALKVENLYFFYKEVKATLRKFSDQIFLHLWQRLENQMHKLNTLNGNVSKMLWQHQLAKFT